MSELFPELDREAVRYLLRDGVRVTEGENKLREVVDLLQDLRVLTVDAYAYARCAYRGDYDFRDRQLNCEGRVEIVDGKDEYYCPECGQPIGDIERKTHFIEYGVTLSPEGIESYLLDALDSLESTQSSELVGPSTYDVLTVEDTHLTVVVPDIVPEYGNQEGLRARAQLQSAGFFFSDPTLYVIASPIHERTRTPLEEAQYAGLADLLSLPRLEVEEKILAAATPVERRYCLCEIERRFDEMIARRPERDWQFFEQQFVPALLDHIARNPGATERYLRLLRRLSQTIFCHYHVPVGGAGRPDFISVNKFELMRQFFQGNIEGDAKCYTKSTLSDSDMAKIAYHLDRSNSEADLAVVFVAGHQVSSTAWVGMNEMKRKGEWRIIIMPKYLILEIIAALEADHLLDM